MHRRPRTYVRCTMTTDAAAARDDLPWVSRSGSRGPAGCCWRPCSGSGLAFIDGTVVNVALPSIGESLDAGVSGLQWTINAYTLTPRVADPARRLAGRPLRPAPGLPHRRGVVRGRVAALRHRAERRGTGRRPGGAGGRRGAADTRQPRDPAVVVPAPGPDAGDRRLVRTRWHRGGGRSVPRRLPRPERRLALGLPHQPAARRGRRAGHHAARPGEQRPAGVALPRPDRGRARARSASAR